MSRRGGGDNKNQQLTLELGLNLRELGVVAVILGVTAMIVILSLGGVVSQSAVAACQANATAVESAVGEFNAETGGTSTEVTSALLTSAPKPFLSSFPSSPDYKISIVSGVVMIAAPPTSTPVPYGSVDACAHAGQGQ
jgi:Tfp pilus assembly protein PilE